MTCGGVAHDGLPVLGGLQLDDVEVREVVHLTRSSVRWYTEQSRPTGRCVLRQMTHNRDAVGHTGSAITVRRVEDDPFLVALGAEARGELASIGHLRRYLAGAVLFLQGDPGTHVVVVRTGTVTVARTSTDGHESLLGIRGPGSLLGELAGLDLGEVRRSASVTARTDVTAHVIPRAEFLDFVERRPHVLLEVTRLLARRLMDADRQRADVGAYDALGRVVRGLVERAVNSEVGPDGTIRIDPPLTQAELAQSLGVSRESVTRALVELRGRGLVRTGRRSLTVVDLDALRASAP